MAYGVNVEEVVVAVVVDSAMMMDLPFSGYIFLE
jgi:hypothetical protein